MLEGLLLSDFPLGQNATQIMLTGMLDSLLSLDSPLAKINIKGHVSACLNSVLKDVLLR